MTLKYLTRFALAIVMMGMLLSSKCSKDPIPAAPDPCVDITPFKADFVMLEEVADTSFEVKDSAIVNRFITFKAVGEYDSVKWEIGNSQNVFKKSSVSLFFNVLENRIPVKFTGYNSKGAICFPATPKVQSVTKYLSIKPEINTSLIGSYWGYNINNPADTFTVTFQLNNNGLGFVKNLPKGCEGYESNSSGYWDYNFGLSNIAYGTNGFRQKKAFAPKCGQIDSKGYLIDNDTLVIKYQHWQRINDIEFELTPISNTYKGFRRK